MTMKDSHFSDVEIDSIAQAHAELKKIKENSLLFDVANNKEHYSKQEIQ